MAHFPSSRLSRQELYSYGFQEGQPWGEDRRTLESALREMDQLEREIQQNYIYGRPTPNNPYAPSPAIPRQGATLGGYFAPGQYPIPDVRIARSDASDGSSEMSSVPPYSGRGYDYSTGYRDPVNSSYDNAQPGWRQAPPNFQRSPSGSAVAQNFQSFPAQYFASPPPRMSPSTSRNFHSIEDPSNYSISPPYYGSRASNTSRSSNAANTAAQPLSPSQMQLVPFNNGQAAASDYGAPEEERYTSPTSPQWSMDATLGTAVSDRFMSATSSQGIYPEGLALSDYSDVTQSSGYVESYDVASYGDYRHDSEDDRDYMSDDIASNEGEYYSSGEEPEYEGEGDDVYSDGGYSDSYNDGSYSSD